VKYAVLGSAGQLGRDLCALLPGEVVPLTRSDADLTCPEALHRRLREIQPGAVVNCAAYNFVDRAEAEPDAAFAVNAAGVRALAGVCRDLGAFLVHFSTDYVFGADESRRAPYTEDDEPGPVSVYGRSKLEGEKAVRASGAEHLIVRTCGLYGVWGSGGKGGNFVETMLRLAREGKPLRVVDDQICTPSYCPDVARAVVALLGTEARGTFHATNGGSCSWYEFARAIFKLAGMQVDVAPITSAEYGAAARRPAYSVLDCSAYHRLGLPLLRPWRDALAAYLAERREKPLNTLNTRKKEREEE
jgi:dTDP-4-dehydrorhamnose reductase